MEPEDLEDRLRRHEAMMEGLAKVWMRQSEINERLDGAIARLDTFIGEQRGMNERLDSYLARQDVLNERLIGAIERLDKTQADITLLLQRVIRGSGNGREA
jgi:hypothetical protein